MIDPTDLELTVLTIFDQLWNPKSPIFLISIRDLEVLKANTNLVVSYTLKKTWGLLGHYTDTVHGTIFANHKNVELYGSVKKVLAKYPHHYLGHELEVAPEPDVIKLTTITPRCLELIRTFLTAQSQ